MFDLGEAMSLNELAQRIDSARVVVVTPKLPPGTPISDYLGYVGNRMLDMNYA
jgi:hypothetical protein